MFDHEDECDKAMYEGGTCTCDLIRDEIAWQNAEEAGTAAAEAAPEYTGPELDS